jgi:IS30 family transposase
MQENYTTTYNHLSLAERQLIEKWFKEGMSRRQIAKLLGRSHQTINNEVKRGQVQRFCCKVFQKIYFSVKLRKKTERTE